MKASEHSRSSQTLATIALPLDSLLEGPGVCGGALDTGGVLAVEVELLKAEVAGTFEVTAVEGGAVEGGATAVVVAEATI